MILALRTDSDEATLTLLDSEGARARQDNWQPGRQLSGELLPHIEALLKKSKAEWHDLTGIIVFRGPGSFTGLRIGCSVANAIAYAQNIPIVGTKEGRWHEIGLQRLKKGDNDQQVLPHYGAPPNITKPRGAA